MYSSNFVLKRRNKIKVSVRSRINIEYVTGDYTRNIYGWLRNDFAELQESNDSLSMARILQRMQEFKDSGGDNADKSFDEIISLVKPRWCQSPAELDRFELWCINNALEQYSKLKELDEQQKEAIRKAAEQHETELLDKLRSNIDIVKSSSVEPQSE